MNLDLLIDIGLCSSILLIAVLALNARQVFTSIVLFVTLGLLAALCWARLQAWDIAIAEAAIGAGLTGGLLLAAWRRLQMTEDQSEKVSRADDHVR